MNLIWIYFKRNAKGLRDTYHFLRIIHQEKNGDDFEKPFKCSINEISYRSLLCKSQTKKYVSVLIELGLVEREHIKKKSKDKDFKSEAFYKVKKINEEMIHKIDNETKYGAVALLEVINCKLGKELT
jgi:hypothetical protein